MKRLKLIKALFFASFITSVTSCGVVQVDKANGLVGCVELNELQASYMVEIDRKNLAHWQDSIFVDALNKITIDTVPRVPDSLRAIPIIPLGNSNNLKSSEIPVRIAISDDCCNTAIGQHAARSVKGAYQHDNPPSRIVMKCRCGQILNCTGNCTEIICIKCSRKYHTK